jgi:outer membrane protein W
MKRKTILFFGLMTVFGLGFRQGILAEDNKPFGVGVFGAYYNTSSTDFNDIDASFETVPVFGGLMTYQFTPKYSMELWTTQYTTDMDLSFDSKEGKLGELDQIPVLLTGRFQIPIRKSTAKIYLGAGLGYVFNDFEQSNHSEPEDFFALNLETKQVDDCVLYALNAGAEMRIQKQYAFFGDLKVLFSEPNFDVVFMDGTTDSKKVGINASVLSFGFKYLF